MKYIADQHRFLITEGYLFQHLALIYQYFGHLSSPFYTRASSHSQFFSVPLHQRLGSSSVAKCVVEWQNTCGTESWSCHSQTWGWSRARQDSLPLWCKRKLAVVSSSVRVNWLQVVKHVRCIKQCDSGLGDELAQVRELYRREALQRKLLYNQVCHY